MSSQSNERMRNRPLSYIILHAHQLLRVKTQRAANWFRKPSFPRLNLKFPSSRSRSSSPRSPYSHSSSTDDTSIRTSSSATLHSIIPRAPQTTSIYSTRLVRTSPDTWADAAPVMPTVRLFLFNVLEADHHVSFFSFGSNPHPLLIPVLSPINQLTCNISHGTRVRVMGSSTILILTFTTFTRNSKHHVDKCDSAQNGKWAQNLTKEVDYPTFSKYISVIIYTRTSESASESVRVHMLLADGPKRHRHILSPFR